MPFRCQSVSSYPKNLARSIFARHKQRIFVGLITFVSIGIWGGCGRNSVGNSASNSTSNSTAGPTIPQIATNALPVGAVGVGYGAGLTATNGMPPYTWGIISGQLPPGLNLQSSTGQIMGTPSQAGTSSFSVRVTDSSNQSSSANFSANIAPADSPVVSSISPASGPTSGGTTVTINGSNFSAGAAASFGGIPATSVTVSSPSQMQAVTPAHIAGSVGIIVEENGQSSMSSSNFTYISTTSTPWNLVWNDEFNGTSLDTSKWAPVEKAGAIVQYTSRTQNISVSDSNLNLTALNDNYTDPSGVTHSYTSGYIYTKGIQTWNGGAFEIRAQLSAGDGMHPTFWFLNAAGDTFSMMEAEGNDDTTVYANEDNKGASDHYYFPSGTNYADGFHVYRMEWDASTQPATFKNYVDGVPYSTEQHDTSSGSYWLILNVAAVTYTGGIDSTTPFPNTMKVDYVRVYQKSQ